MTLSQRDVLFLDDDSASDLQWAVLWQSFAPMTAQGRRVKAALVPYRAGDEAAVTQVFAQLQADADALDADAVTQFVESMQPVPDVDDSLQTLRQPKSVMSMKQLLVLKQFLYYGARLAADAAIHWTSAPKWGAVLAHFGDVCTPSFAVNHVADADWHAAAETVTKATRDVTVAVQHRDRQWHRDINVRPTREAHIVLHLPEQRAVLDQLMMDARLTWLRNTPFEAVFVLHPTPELTTASECLARAKETLETVQDAVLRRLCDTLRASLPDLQQLVSDIANLDLRIAKVRLLRQWKGCVPVLGDTVRLEGGVHPIVAARLHASDLHASVPLPVPVSQPATVPAGPAGTNQASGTAAYVPLDFDPDLGPNVLCGANMGGKTVAMSLLCLCQAFAQYGLPVPAQSFTTRLFRFIRFCGRADTDVANGLSAFGWEITVLHRTWALWQDVGDGLVCLDEPARSTNPVEGEALVVALLRLVRAQPRGSVWVVATHLAGAVAQPGVTKFRVRGLTGKLPVSPPGTAVPDARRLEWLAQAMDYRVVRMRRDAPPGEALQVARWLGLSEDVLKETQRYLGEGTL